MKPSFEFGKDKESQVSDGSFSKPGKTMKPSFEIGI